MSLLRAGSATFALFSLVALAAACSSSGGDAQGPGGGGADGGAAEEEPGPHPLCAAGGSAKTFAADIGKSCGAGSNKDLCVVSGPSCSSGHCLWDDTDPSASFGRAYCTIACDPGDADACPTGFACKAQGCGDGPTHVCVGKAPEPERDCDEVGAAMAGRSVTIMDLTASAGGRVYVTAAATSPAAFVVLSREGGGAWSKIHEQESTNALSPAKAATAGGLSLLNLGARSAGIARGAVIEIAELAACEGDPNKCQREISMLFVTTKGEARGVVRNLNGDQWLVPLAKGTLPEGAAHETLISQVTQLAEGGALALCRAPDAESFDDYTLCASDGDAFADIALPASEELATGLVAAGASADDFYVLVASGKLYHRLAGEWFEEGVSGRPATDGRFSNASISRAADGTILLRVDNPDTSEDGPLTLTYGLVGGCWRALPRETPVGGAPLEGLTFLSPTSTEVCRLTVNLGS